MPANCRTINGEKPKGLFEPKEKQERNSEKGPTKSPKKVSLA
jgi:hypothetical protein